jgi:hypothetical protein
MLLCLRTREHGVDIVACLQLVAWQEHQLVVIAKAARPKLLPEFALNISAGHSR